jgi:hypothetical protein
MICKYCHENTHYIDVCPIIICKICKDIGHPQWLCLKKKNNNKFIINDKKDNKKEEKYINKNIEINTEIKKDKETEIKKDNNFVNNNFVNNNFVNNNFVNNNLINKNLNYYIKKVNDSWCNYII